MPDVPIQITLQGTASVPPAELPPHTHSVSDISALGADLTALYGAVASKAPMDHSHPQPAPGDLRVNILDAFAARRVHYYRGEPPTIAEQIRYEVSTHLGTSPVGFDGAHAPLVSTIADGKDVLLVESPEANTGYLDIRHLRFLNFALKGNGAEGNGLTVRAYKNGAAGYKLLIDKPTIQGVGGDGISLQGWMFENDILSVQIEACKGHGISLLRDTTTNGNSYHTQTVIRGQVIRSCMRAGVYIQSPTRRVQVQDIRFISNKWAGLIAENGIDEVRGCIFENNGQAQDGGGAVVSNYGYFQRCFFTSSLGYQPVAVRVPYLIGDLVMVDCETGEGMTALVHVAAANATGRVIIRGRNAATAIVTGVLPAERIIRVM